MANWSDKNCGIALTFSEDRDVREGRRCRPDRSDHLFSEDLRLDLRLDHGLVGVEDRVDVVVMVVGASGVAHSAVFGTEAGSGNNHVVGRVEHWRMEECLPQEDLEFGTCPREDRSQESSSRGNTLEVPCR